jgi:serine/threonine protein kinase
MPERFRLVRKLAAGAFGQTLLVEDSEGENRRVVIKVPHDKAKEKALIDEMINNAALIGSLNKATHPNIVRFFGCGLFKGTYVMIMEYVPGKDLSKFMERGNLDVDASLRVSTDILKGLSAAHRIELIHRDIKPANILIRETDGLAKLTDFGVGKIVQSTMPAGSVAGTPAYMAPEAFRRSAATPLLDLWSMHVTLYEMLTAKLPFMAESLGELMDKVCKETPARPSRLNKKITPQLEGFVMRGLEKEPRHRFQTAEETLNELGRFYAGAAATLPNFEEEIKEARELFSAGKEDQAEQRMDELLEKFPLHPKVLVALSAFHNLRQRYQRSEQVLREGIERWPNDAGLLLSLARSLAPQGGGKIPEAVVLLEKAIELGLPPAHQREARILLRSWRKS